MMLAGTGGSQRGVSSSVSRARTPWTGTRFSGTADMRHKASHRALENLAEEDKSFPGRWCQLHPPGVLRWAAALECQQKNDSRLWSGDASCTNLSPATSLL